MKWRKATPGQIMGDGDEILVSGINHENGQRWFDMVRVSCDEDCFELLCPCGQEGAEITWGDIDYWCYTKDIPHPEA